MPKTYNCLECRESMEAKYSDQNDKTIWYCRKCDAFFSIEVPFKYTINEDNAPTQEDIVGVNSAAELGQI